MVRQPAARGDVLHTKAPARRTDEEIDMKLTRLARIAGVLLALSGASAVVACNTVEGAGKDLERGGEKVQDTAKDVKQKM